ncbi:ADP-ribosylglycohydrolase family protein [Streptomyces kunmingensis]|uniref:ADP-ribosylglycohydrolase family protein n=1 Tax=Streptomyces kunmingensis TaxID=68225 RepID=UPI002D77118E|nr:ADP-ribosylglycohydrolase family protein [Streptomyces kunmingensis]
MSELPAPRFVEREYINPRFEEDLRFNSVSGPERYASGTGLPVQYIAVADQRGTVTGYVWATDEEDAGGAAGQIDRRDAGNKAVDLRSRLDDAKARGLAPSAALQELIAAASAGGSPFSVAGPLATAPHLDALDELADRPARGRVRRAARGTLFGLAIGDAMGRPLAPLSMARITAEYGNWATMELPLYDGGDAVRVSDTTQLALALAEALAETAVRAPLTEAEARHSLTTRGALPAPPWITPRAVTHALRSHLVRWRHSPDNDRAPGRTTLDACAALEGQIPWQAASAPTSKGCAAVVRAAAVGLVPYVSAEQRSGIAQLQAALTHGHPTALAASDLAAHAVHLLVHRCEPAALLGKLRAHAAASRRTYRTDWLGDLADRAGAESPASYIAAGWDECLAALDSVAEALRAKDPNREPGAAAGTDWTADHVLAGALYAYLVTDGRPRDTVRRAAHTSGASAATAALAGAFAGAHRGTANWPREWVQAMEYRERIEALGAGWDRTG